MKATIYSIFRVLHSFFRSMRSRQSLRRASVALRVGLALLMVAPASLYSPPRALAEPCNNGNPSNQGDVSEECDPCNDKCPLDAKPTQGNPTMEKTEYPVSLYRGSAIERETDLVVPGPSFRLDALKKL